MKMDEPRRAKKPKGSRTGKFGFNNGLLQLDLHEWRMVGGDKTFALRNLIYGHQKRLRVGARFTVQSAHSGSNLSLLDGTPTADACDSPSPPAPRLASAFRLAAVLCPPPARVTPTLRQRPSPRVRRVAAYTAPALEELEEPSEGDAQRRPGLDACTRPSCPSALQAQDWLPRCARSAAFTAATSSGPSHRRQPATNVVRLSLAATRRTGAPSNIPIRECFSCPLKSVAHSCQVARPRAVNSVSPPSRTTAARAVSSNVAQAMF